MGPVSGGEFCSLHLPLFFGKDLKPCLVGPVSGGEVLFTTFAFAFLVKM